MDELKSEIDRLLKASDLTQKELKRVDKVIEAARNIISTAQSQIDDEKTLGSLNASDHARQVTLDVAPKLFTGEVEDAVIKNDEFAYYAFLDPLFRISHYDDLFSLSIVGNGWERRAVVTINMDEVAGNIDDYAQAVESTRSNLNVSKGDPVKASEIWRTKIYPNRGGFSAYGLTISERLSESSSPAPFWSLLNNGNKTYMSSDRGGSPYPNRPGTHFVENAKKRIEDEFRFQMSNLRQMSASFVNDLMVDIRLMEQGISALLAKVNKLSVSAEIMDAISLELGIDRDKLSSQKLYRAKSQLESGELRSQYYIGAPGYRKRIRPGRLQKILSSVIVGD